MSKKTKLAIIGATGKTGHQIMLESLKNHTIYPVIKRSSPLDNKDISEFLHIPNTGIKFTSNLENSIKESDVIIDFSNPETTLEVLELAKKYKKPIVIGTTGFTVGEESKILEFSKEIPILKSANMSIGINLLSILVSQTADALGEEFDIEILEMHHNKKIDSPSGTALMLGKSASKAKGVPFKDPSTNRAGLRKSGDIGYAVLRGGDVIGEHKVMFVSGEERIELTHKMQTRAGFAKGAIKAGLWVKVAKAGLYSMIDVFARGDEGNR